MNHHHGHSSDHMLHDTHPHHVDANHKQSNTSKHHHLTTSNHHSMMMVCKFSFTTSIISVQMFFHGGFTETILFEPWTTTSVPGDTFQMNSLNRYTLIFI